MSWEDLINNDYIKSFEKKNINYFSIFNYIENP